MSWLLLSILSATGIFLCFGLFSRWHLNNKVAIATNYSVAALAGTWLAPFPKEQLLNPWMLMAVFIGLAFVYLFFKMARLTQEGGMSLGTISSQMSLVIPVLLAPLLYGEALGWMRLLGILLGLASIYLLVQQSVNTELPTPQNAHTGKDAIIVFVGTGLCTTLLKFSRVHFVTDAMEIGFVAFIFGVSALSSWWAVFQEKDLATKVFWRSVGGGIILGIPNLGSLVFLIRALATPGLDSTVVFPINNVGVVLLSSVLGWLLFKERLGRAGFWGVSLAVAGVLILTL